MRVAIHTFKIQALLLFAFSLFLGGCATNTFRAVDVSSADFLNRTQQQKIDGIIVSAAAPDAQETEQLTGLNLYDQGVQPIWLRIENTTANRIRLNLWSIDRDYFSPIEVAYTNRKKFTNSSYSALESWFNDNGMSRHIPPGESRSGLVFTHLTPGTKGFNLDIIGDQKASTFTFFLPMPGFTPDYMHIDFKNLYPTEQIKNFSSTQLMTEMEQNFPCCTESQSGEKNGAPINVILVGTPTAVRRSLLRGNWLETSIDNEMLEQAEQQHYDGRPVDGTFYQDREDGNERIQLNIWMTSLRVDSTPVWAAQAFYRNREYSILNNREVMQLTQNTPLLHHFVNDSISADMDSAKAFTLQNFWYNNCLEKLAIVGGVEAKSIDNPGTTFDGLGYVTDGTRAVLFLSEQAQAYDDVEIISTGLLGLSTRGVSHD
ncbi:MAG: hypothetical protein V7746_08125 [Halioglobus sp.]